MCLVCCDGNQQIIQGLVTRLGEQLRAGAPPNWTFGNDWPMPSVIAEVVEQDGIPLAWVPRGDIVLALVQAEGIEARRAILADRETDILEDCTTCFDNMTGVRPVGFLENAREAAAAFRDGHARAAQALATVVLDATLRLLYITPAFSYRGVRTRLVGVWEDASLQDMRPALVLAAIPGALKEFWPDRGDSVPARFNRHASAHTVHAEQYTRTNALVAIMTITSLLREAHESEWYLEADTQRPHPGI